MNAHTPIALPALARSPIEARQFGLDDFRRRQLIRMDRSNLVACASWGSRNAHWSDETIFAENCLANRAEAA